MNLRRGDSSLQDRMHRIPISPPEVYFKQIEVSKKRHSTSDLDHSSNMSQLSHLFMHRNGHPGANLVEFEAGLRSARTIDKRLRDREKRWRNLPKVDRKEPPSFLNQKSINKIKEIEQGDMDLAMDGHLNFPKFDDHVKERDVSKVRHLYRGEFKLPTLQWQISLRGGVQ